MHMIGHMIDHVHVWRSRKLEKCRKNEKPMAEWENL